MFDSCLNCNKDFNEEGYYITDCFEGFGIAGYCKECILEGVRKGFDDPKVTCSCGERMNPWYTDDCEDEGDFKAMSLTILDRDGVIFYRCSKCPQIENGIGLYVNQRDEVIDLVFEGGVHPDELEHEYVYDFLYALNYHYNNSALYKQPYDPNWQEVMMDIGYEVEF